MKIRYKNIALVTTVATGLALLSVIPANAAANTSSSIVLVAGGSTNVAVGQAATATIRIAGTASSAPVSAGTITVSQSTPAASASVITSSATAATGAQLQIPDGSSMTRVTSSTYSQPTLTITPSTASATFVADHVLSITPDVAGTYSFTFTPASNLTGATAVTWTFTAGVDPVALYVDSSSGSDFTDGTGTLTVDAAGGASEDLIAGTSTAFAAADVGKAIYTDAGAYICTIGSVASATSANCLDNVASDVGTVGSSAVAYKLGNASTAGVRTANPILASTQISGLTVTAGKKVNLVVKSTSGNQADASKLRVAVNNIGTLVTGLDPAAAGLTNAVNFTAPSVAGTYALTITYSTDGTDFTNFTEPNAAAISFTLTVTADSVFSADVSTVYMNDNGAETDTNTTAATTALGASGVSTVDTLGAVIWFNAKKANGTTYSGGTFYAYMTGPGKLDIDGTTYIRSESISNTGQHYVKVAGDGTTGVGTVVMYMILADGVTRVNLPSRTVSFYGSVAKLEATVVQGIATAGVANGACGGLTDCTYATLAEKPAVLIKATDANGVLVPGLTITGTTADGTVIASSAVSEGTGGTDYNGAGYYNGSVTGGSITGKSANVTYSTTLSTGVVISSNAVSFANAGTPRTVTWAIDKTSYEPGAQILITVTAKDANGNAAADGTYANLFAGATTASGSITGSTPAASVELVGGKKEYKAFAPGTGGSYTITNTTGTSTGASAGAVLTGTVVVNNPNAGLLTQIDALNAKIVALNALIAKIMKKLGVK